MKIVESVFDYAMNAYIEAAVPSIAYNEIPGIVLRDRPMVRAFLDAYLSCLEHQNKEQDRGDE